MEPIDIAFANQPRRDEKGFDLTKIDGDDIRRKTALFGWMKNPETFALNPEWGETIASNCDLEDNAISKKKDSRKWHLIAIVNTGKTEKRRIWRLCENCLITGRVCIYCTAYEYGRPVEEAMLVGEIYWQMQFRDPWDAYEDVVAQILNNWTLGKNWKGEEIVYNIKPAQEK